jgi:hypothetical protein
MKEPNMTYIDQAFAKMIEAGLEEVERTTEKEPVPDGIWAPNSRWEYGDDEGPEWPFSKFEEIYVLTASGYRYEITPVILPDYWRISILILSPDVGDVLNLGLPAGEDIELGVNIKDDEVGFAMDLAVAVAVEEISTQLHKALETDVVRQANALAAKFRESANQHFDARWRK